MFNPKKKVFKKIGLFTLILITINSILGSGIFALPGKVFQLMAGNF
jgi:amino acid transporter